MEISTKSAKDNGMLSRLAATIEKTEGRAAPVMIVSTTALKSARESVKTQLPEELFGCLCHAPCE